jgi:protein-tyrosine phosphatase
MASSLIPGTFNARDLGGLRTADGRTRSGVIFRSDAPVALGNVGHEMVRKLGVRVAVDLREPGENELDQPDFGDADVEVRANPILGPGFEAYHASSLEEIYFHLLEARGDRLASAVDVLMQPESVPGLVFCSAGKDRTGLTSMLLLGAVGVVDEDIIADYHRTEDSLHGPFRELISRRAALMGFSEQELAAKAGAPRELMRSVLGWLRQQHGGASGYLEAHGVARARIESLGRRFVEDSGTR